MVKKTAAISCCFFVSLTWQALILRDIPANGNEAMIESKQKEVMVESMKTIIW
jgi:hypothetical protein